ncbi:ArsA family ATPase [Streptomyces sp. HNM0575]|uniref:ArsA family ATPase n=1 Tax=Streptomyces sp. HNM0575 TaxID=2716338 RepID=UPI00145CD9CD|nr:ArsA family ATPase [Streptomyces sp. HNM0575]NLU75562.1 ArsA family ATPase [Streptomyces sp. HNM0575]
MTNRGKSGGKNGGGRRTDSGKPTDRGSQPAEAQAQAAQAPHTAHGGPGNPLDSGPPLHIDPLIEDPETRIIVCCGAGGVGKTTTAAAIGLRAAERGRKTVVLTIDPARRLAQSMGLTELDNTPRPVPGVDGAAGGELHAMMLDMKRTFDEIVEAHADPERARAIMSNPFYESLSAGFAGTQEYMAMEKLGQLSAHGAGPDPQDEDGSWDLIVVDTPPSRSALDFLDAPKRLGSFLDGRFIKMLMAPAKAGGRAGMKVVNLGMAGLSMFTGALDKLLGKGLLRDVQTFVAAMDTMFGGFRTRADATYRLLQAPGTAFLVVAAPERDALREAAYFVERLAEERMPLAGLVLNRVHGSGASSIGAERALALAENLEEGGIVDRGPGKGNRHGAHSPGRGSPDDHVTDGPRDSREDDHVPDPDSTTRPESAAEPSGRDVHTGQTEQLAAALLRLHAERMRLLTRERRTRDRFAALHPEVPVAEVGALPGDVHDLAGLRTIGELLAAEQPAA